MQFKEKAATYIKELFGPAARLKRLESLGEGTHGKAYRVSISTPEEEKHLILKTLFPSRLGHDHFSDRARVLLLAHANYKRMEKHIHLQEISCHVPRR